MERVLHNKVLWLVKQARYDITIITTDQGSSPTFYQFPPEVNIIDLGINYSSDYSRPPLERIFALRKKRRLHKKRLSELLFREHPDITIALYPSEVSVVPQIRDGSKKILEFHSNRDFRLNQGFKGIHLLVAKYRCWKDTLIASKFDKCVVLTHEAAEQWSDLDNIEVIPNSVTATPDITADVDTHRIIAVGRLIYEKGFDRLLQAWALVPDGIKGDWKLNIFGDGVLREQLNGMIARLGLEASTEICRPTKEIFKEYAQSAFLVMSSRSEGFGMVMLEAMSCGLPVVSFDFMSGPREIIQEGTNGIIVKNGDIRSLAQSMRRLMENRDLRHDLASHAKDVLIKFSEDRIMEMWETCFNEICLK
ncbi:MAG: glycosyltransferase family 4 protein [Bacteroidales bacterium]|nr:glycosyltransferase family 4 protein [Bacteroidales bacterium]